MKSDYHRTWEATKTRPNVATFVFWLPTARTWKERVEAIVP